MIADLIPGIGGILAVLVAAFVAARKSKPEAGKLVAETDLIRVEAQAKVIDSLTDELDRAAKYIQQIKREKDAEIAEMRELIRTERAAFDTQLKSLRADCDRLRGRIEEMERRETTI